MGLKNKNKLDRKILTYSLTASTVLLGSESIRAQVSGVSINHDIGLNQTYNVAFNGIDKFAFKLSRTIPKNYGYIKALTSSASWIKNGLKPKALSSGYVVSAMRSFTRTGTYRQFFSVYVSGITGLAWYSGASFQNQTKYIGVKFKLGANTHYGWIKITVTNRADKITVVSAAYEQTGGGSITANGVLPVELTNFNAVLLENKIKLIWETATEINNYGFQVQRQREKDKSENLWEDLGFVGGNGNSNSPNQYEFIDENPPNGRLEYRLKQIDFDGTSTFYDLTASVNNGITSQEEKQFPAEFSLSQNYPNPFNPATKIKFGLPENSEVTIKVFNTLGQEVAEILNGYIEAGRHEINFDAGALPSGFYIYRLVSSNGYALEKKMLLVK